MNLKNAKIGMIGLGNMGSGIARNILKSGFELRCFDKKKEALEALVMEGAIAAESTDQLISTCDIVLTCLLGAHSVPFYDSVVIPAARKGQVVIDFATVPVPDNRRIYKNFAEKNVDYLDAPISGGRYGAADGMLRIFIGGKKDVADFCWPLFEAAGNPDKLVYCGGSGFGQVVKVVQQLSWRLPDMARMEVVQFGLKSDLGIDLIRKALDVEKEGTDFYARMCRNVEENDISRRDYEFPEWEFYFKQAKEVGFKMPILETINDIVKDAPHTTKDGADRTGPSVWDEFMKL